ncbi:MAG: creatininase family protein [Defluviitaleaceae bacterium]|nr:creatininase family protein [Defluviitaleaceae bacterium]
MRWEELSSKEMKQLAVDSGGVCILPIGCLEKHGDHLPTGTDMYIGRAIVEQAAKVEKALVFPYYFMGQASECTHYVGCIGASHELILSSLLEMCDEISRNGFKKIIIYNSHGGNIHFLDFFAMKMAGLQKDYVVYISGVWSLTDESQQKIYDVAGTTDLGEHAGLGETSVMLYLRPDLVHMDRQDSTRGYRQNKLPYLKKYRVFSGLKWYSDFPEHYAGEHSNATPELGKLIVDVSRNNLCEIIRNVKADDVTLALYKEYNANVCNPL